MRREIVTHLSRRNDLPASGVASVNNERFDLLARGVSPILMRV